MPSKNVFPEEVAASRPAEILLRAAEENRFPQSLILTAKDFALLETVGEHLAANLLRRAAPTAEAAALPLASHPDFFTVRPAKKMRQISAEDTRELIRKICHSPQVSKKKVAILYEAERMHQTAFNIFLKTLEEPPADTVILLLTTQPYGLLPTIRSRCLTFRFPDTDTTAACPEAMREWLDAYRTWLGDVAAGVRKPPEVASSTIRLFGLLTRFQHVLEQETSRSWADWKEKLPAHLESEQQEALEEGVKVAVRHRFLLEIERATHEFGRELGRKEKVFPARALTGAVRRLEKCAGLLRVNLKEQAALEHFLLHSLRLWARR